MSKSKILLLISALRIFLAFLLLFSAIAKIISIDQFELYIFSQQIIGFNLSSVVARLIISLEIAIGLLFLLNIQFKIIYKLTIFVLCIFSVFLIYKLFIGSAENCNCYGELIKMNPAESFIKNIVFIGMLILIRKNKEWKIKYKNHLTIFIAILALTIPSILSPPDFIIEKLYDNKYEIDGKDHIVLSDEKLDYKNGKKALVFLIIDCRFCSLSTQKISIIAERENLQENIYYYFAGIQEEYSDIIDSFWVNSNSISFQYSILPINEMIKVTNGRFPTIIFAENGKVINKFGYRNFTEKDFVDFFNN